MKIKITAVHNKRKLIDYINIKERCGIVEAQRKVLDVMYNYKSLITDADYSDILLLKKICIFKVIKVMKQNQFEFKPFDKVLVKNYNNDNWKCGIFSHYDSESSAYPYVCVGGQHSRCIPYNEQTAHLVGTNQPYSSEKKIHVWNQSTFDEWMTEEEFKNFINTAVIHNKDICDFHVLYVQ